MTGQWATIRHMQPTGERWRLGNRPALDGIRGIAILLVVLGHASPLLRAAGAIGVTLFFALSGFLITTLLLEEHAGAGRVNLLRFYERRARRLLPAFAAYLAVVSLLSLALGAALITPGAVVSAVTYTFNWWMIAKDSVPIATMHLWSLAVEEQFYLVWPLVLIACARFGRRWLIGMCLAGSIAATVARWLLWESGSSGSRVYIGTDVRADSLLAGCLLAVVMVGARERRNRPLLAAGLLLSFVPLLPATGDLRWVLVPTVVPWVSAATIWCTAQARRIPWLEQRWLVIVGRRSYALYLWHGLTLSLAPLLPLSEWVTVPIGIVLAWGLTLVSWRYVEEPFLRKRRGEERPRLEVLEVGSAVVRVKTNVLVDACRDVLAHDLERQHPTEVDVMRIAGVDDADPEISRPAVRD